MKPERMYTGGQMLDALALWEAAIQVENENDGLNFNPLVEEFFSDGQFESRQRVINLLDKCNAEYVIAEEHGDFHYPYDWEWCPRWLRRIIVRPTERPLTRIVAICDEARAEFGDS